MNRILKRLLCCLLMVILAFLLLIGCGSRKQELAYAPLSTGGVSAAVSAPVDAQTNTAVDASTDKTQCVIVYVTETGNKYHCSGCSYLAKSCVPVELETARQRYGPCSKCCPPT